MTLQANQFAARSPLYRLQAGATLAPFGESCIVTTYGQGDESALLGHCALLDLTNLARYGLRGPAAVRRLEADDRHPGNDGNDRHRHENLEQREALLAKLHRAHRETYSAMMSAS